MTKFLQIPSIPKKKPGNITKGARVLTSVENMLQLEEKERIKKQVAEEKEKKKMERQLKAQLKEKEKKKKEDEKKRREKEKTINNIETAEKGEVKLN